MPRRKIDVSLVFGQDGATATDADGFSATLPLPADAPVADKQEAARENIVRNLGKRTDHFDFKCDRVEQSPVRFYPASILNALRRALAENLTKQRMGTVSPKNSGIGPNSGRIPEKTAKNSGIGPQSGPLPQDRDSDDLTVATTSGSNRLTGDIANYSANCANHLAREVLTDLGYKKVEDAYEIKPVPDAELMRSRYCIKYELGLCPRLHPSSKVKEPLSLVNAGRRLKLSFDCKRCEMIVHL